MNKGAPVLAKTYYNRGIGYAKLKRYRQAIAEYVQAIRVNPRDAKAYRNRGLAYFRLNQDRQAVADLDQAIRFNPRDANAYFIRGLIHQYTNRNRRQSWLFGRGADTRLKQLRKAIADYDQAIRLNPRYAKAYKNRGLIYRYLYKNRRQAIADFRTAYKLRPRDSRVANQLREMGVEP